MTPHQKISLGEQGELTAMLDLKRRGYRIIKHHWRSAFGEIDIIARRGREVYFVEVKTRRSDSCGTPLEAISPRQRRRIIRSALAYLSEVPGTPHQIHFSVMGIDLLSTGQDRIVFLKDAFEQRDFDGFSL